MIQVAVTWFQCFCLHLLAGEVHATKRVKWDCLAGHARPSSVHAPAQYSGLPKNPLQNLISSIKTHRKIESTLCWRDHNIKFWPSPNSLLIPNSFCQAKLQAVRETCVQSRKVKDLEKKKGRNWYPNKYLNVHTHQHWNNERLHRHIVKITVQIST